MNMNKYTEKCLQIPNTNQFVQLSSDLMKATGRMFYGKLNQSFHRMNTNSCTQLDHALPNFMGQQKYINCLKLIK